MNLYSEQCVLTVPPNGNSFPHRFAISFLTVSFCSIGHPWDGSVRINIFNSAVSSVIVSNFETQTICISCVGCQRQLLCQTDCAGWICNVPVQNTQSRLKYSRRRQQPFHRTHWGFLGWSNCRYQRFSTGTQEGSKPGQVWILVSLSLLFWYWDLGQEV